MRRILILTVLAVCPVSLHAQARGAAPFDMTGYWVASVPDDRQYRTLTPPEGNMDYLPVNAEGRRITESWDPAKDEANGEQCKAYGAGGVMRLPGRLHITWENDNTLKMELDAGTQTRRFFFGGTQAFPTETTLQGHSVARWDIAAGRGRGSTTGTYGQLTVTTTHLKPGYLFKNGVPYSASTVLNEYFVRLVDKGGVESLAVTIMVDDPQYLQQPYIKTYEYKKQTDASGWNPTSCSAR